MVISDKDLANFIVCPESWRLKLIGKGKVGYSEQQKLSQKERSKWSKEQTRSFQLKLFCKVLFFILTALVGTLILVDVFGGQLPDLMFLGLEEVPKRIIKSSRVPNVILFLLVILGTLIFLWDYFDRQLKNIASSSGLGQKSEIVSLKNSTDVPSTQLFSEKNMLKSEPDAIVKEDKFLIPIDRVPTQKKVRDRHVIRTLLHLKLLEEQEGKPSPYGIILIGKEKRESKIQNSEERQRWLQNTIDEMRNIMDGGICTATPDHYKCKNCEVKDFCEFKA